jgi:hypothetical protein
MERKREREGERGMNGVREIANLCVCCGQVNEVNRHAETALHQAAMKGATLALEFLVTNKAEPNMQNEFGETALHYAVRLGNEHNKKEKQNKRCSEVLFLFVATQRGHQVHRAAAGGERGRVSGGRQRRGQRPHAGRGEIVGCFRACWRGSIESFCSGDRSDGDTCVDEAQQQLSGTRKEIRSQKHDARRLVRKRQKPD